MSRNYEVTIKTKGEISQGWDYPVDYFPRGFHYQKDAIDCQIKAIQKGGRGVEVKKAHKK
jgi:hypothetical protein